MATKAKVPTDEKIDSDLNLFEALAALDRKDYDYYDKLTPEQQKKFVPYMYTHWMSAIKGAGALQGYYLRSVDYHVNKYLFNENVSKHPKLQWLMMCASSPGLGKQFHQWIPHLSSAVVSLDKATTKKEVSEYFKKIYSKQSQDTVNQLAEAFVSDHDRKRHLAVLFPLMKLTDIEALSHVVSDETIAQYDRDSGN